MLIYFAKKTNKQKGKIETETFSWVNDVLNNLHLSEI